MTEDALKSRWRGAFAKCAPTLETLARASDESGRLAARCWWVTCMASQCDECRKEYTDWREQARAALPGQLTAEHTETAVGLPGWDPMATCLMSLGRRAGVEIGRTLEHVEAEGARIQAQSAWRTAVAEVAPLREGLVSKFLPDRPLAQTAGQMDIDELRVCQVWMYGIGSRLVACQERAQSFSTTAGMRDPNTPLLGYNEERWDPYGEPWQALENCVHAQAALAGATADQAWRKPPTRKT